MFDSRPRSRGPFVGFEVRFHSYSMLFDAILQIFGFLVERAFAPFFGRPFVEYNVEGGFDQDHVVDAEESDSKHANNSNGKAESEGLQVLEKWNKEHGRGQFLRVAGRVFRRKLETTAAPGLAHVTKPTRSVDKALGQIKNNRPFWGLRPLLKVPQSPREVVTAWAPCPWDTGKTPVPLEQTMNIAICSLRAALSKGSRLRIRGIPS